MSHLPQLQDELVRAASSHFATVAKPSALARSRRTLALAALLMFGTVGTASAVLVATGTIGGPPSRPVPSVEAEERSGMKRTDEPRTIGTAELPTLGRLELVGYRMRGYGGHGELLCLDVLLLGDGTRAGGCDHELPGRTAGTLAAGGPAAATPRMAVGSTAEHIDSISVHFVADGHPMTVAAEIITVPSNVASDLQAPAFTYYVAEIPATATKEIAEARLDGKEVWRASFR
jgi:hypothetical protein